MKKDDMVVAPDDYKTPGGVPRGILVGVVVSIVVVAVLLFVISSGPKQETTPDLAVQKKLADSSTVHGQAEGKPAAIDELAEDAERKSQDAKRKEAQKQRELKLPEPGIGSDRPALPGIGAAGSGGGARGAGGGVGGPGAVDDQGNIAAEVAARGSPVTAFDESGTSGAAGAIKDVLKGVAGNAAGADGLNAIKAAADVALGGAGQGNGMSELAELMKLGMGQSKGSTKAADANSQWANSQATGANGRAPEVLRPNPPAADLMLTEGTVIPSVTTRQINSDLPGTVTARVMVDVYDSRSSIKLLLPKGALLTGRYNTSVDFGQERLQVVFNRLRMPDGSTYELPGAGGSDAAGRSGLTGDVNRHYLKVYGSALLVGMVADRVVKAQAIPQATNGQGQLSATGQAMVDIVKTELERLKATPVTLTIPEGSRINVEVVRDMIFPSVYKQRGF